MPLAERFRGPTRRWAANTLLLTATAAVVGFPHLIAYRRYGAAAPFKFFANDAFYYLNAAQRSWGMPYYTYDGTHGTTGYHPLWQWLLSLVFDASGWRLASNRQILLTYALCAVLAAAGTALLSLSIARLVGSRVVAFVAVAPGFYDLGLSRLLYSTVDSTESAPWSYVNGMETSLSVFVFGIVMCLLSGAKRGEPWSSRRLLLISAVMTLATLSRLDDVFLLVAFLGAVGLTSTAQAALRRLLVTSIIPTLGIGCYLLHNLYTSGSPMPVSGSMKLNVGAFPVNAKAILQTLIPTELWNTPLLFLWDAHAWRAFQLIVPILVAGAFVIHRLIAAPPEPASTQDDRTPLLMMLAAYVLFKGAYNLLLVRIFAQGHWYFPLSIASVNILVAHTLSSLLSSRGAPRVGVQIGPKAAARAQRILPVAAALLAATAVLLILGKQLQARWLLVGLVLLGLAGIAFVARAPLAKRLERAAAARVSVPLTGFAAVSAFLFAIASANAAVNQKVDAHYADTAAAFWSARKDVDRAVAELPGEARIFELDDGIMGYALTRPSMNAMGLAIDREAHAAWKAGRPFDIAYERGFRVLSSVTYWSYLNQQRRGYARPSSDAKLLESLIGPETLVMPAGAERFKFSLLRVVPVGNFEVYFVAFEPRSRG
jgi:hypothetical protein